VGKYRRVPIGGYLFLGGLAESKYILLLLIHDNSDKKGKEREG
jgi:hypothetical protein